MKYFRLIACIILILGLSDLSFAKGSGQGFMGGSGVMQSPGGGGGGTGDGTGEDDGSGDTGGMPGDVEGPLTDKGSIQGELYGDLYKILRYKGGETKRVPVYDESGIFTHWVEVTAVGGEPVLTEEFATYVDDETGAVLTAPNPSQCVQPVADFRRWGDIGNENKLPLILTYDATWDRTEFEVDPGYFIEEGGTWEDPNNGVVTYPDGVKWTDLVKEVSFGRLNQARAPEEVLMSAFDEAIASINAAADLPEEDVPDPIRLDAAGRILLTKAVYDEYLVDPATGEPIYGYDPDGNIIPVLYMEKAIDSPLENLAIYLKLMRDGHLLTPGDERETIDRSVRGGIPLDLWLGLEDGPSSALRPTLSPEAILELDEAGFSNLVDVVEAVDYYTYFEVVYGPDGTATDYVLHAVPYTDASEVPEGAETWFGIVTDDGSIPTGDDFKFCAATLSAAADKGAKLTIDHVVYINNMLGINKVAGTSEDGTIDYSKNPIYFNFQEVAYNRTNRFWPSDGNGDPMPVTADVLTKVYSDQGDALVGWEKSNVAILEEVDFRELGEFEEAGTTLSADIGGFAQSSDDNLSVIDFVHTFQIPENR